MPGLFTEDTYEQAIIELFENMDYLQNGITVKFFVNGEEQATIVKLWG